MFRAFVIYLHSLPLLRSWMNAVYIVKLFKELTTVLVKFVNAAVKHWIFFWLVYKLFSPSVRKKTVPIFQILDQFFALSSY